MEDLVSAYKGKRVLVTGHTGFKGSWLTIWLKKLGADITGYALDPWTANDNYVLSGISGSIRSIHGDIRDMNKLSVAFTEYRPEIVFHLAANALVLDCYKHPRECFSTNIGGTVNVLENCRHSKSVRAIVIITSDKCYRDKLRDIGRFGGYRETDNLGGLDPYGSSKACTESVVMAYRESFMKDRGLATARAGNIIGGGDWCENRIIPDCIRALEAGRAIKVRNPEAVRPWQYVLDPLYGYLILGARLLEWPATFSEPWNFGPDDDTGVTVRDLVELVLKYWGKGSWNAVDADSPREAMHLALNSNKAQTKLGWLTHVNLNSAVSYTIDWYKQYLKTPDMMPFCVNQISEYMNG